MDTQILIHIRREERERGAEKTAENGIGCQDRSGVNGVGVNQIVHDAKEDQDHTESERDRGDDAHDPVDR